MTRLNGPTSLKAPGALSPPDSTCTRSDEYEYEQEPYVPMPEVTRRPYLTYALLAINVVVFGFAELAGGTEDPDVLLDFGAMFGPLISQG